MIVVFDTNIWISALIFGGAPYSALRQAILQKQIAVSSVIEVEIIHIMVEKFGRTESNVRMELHEFLKDAMFVSVSREIYNVCRDPKDDAILETAWKANADLLVTGDKDLLSLKEFRGTRIVTVAAYLGIV